MRNKLKQEIRDLVLDVLTDHNKNKITFTDDEGIAGYLLNNESTSTVPPDWLINDNTAEGEALWAESELPLNKRAQLLRDAEEIINGSRAQTYGPPEISFNRIAAIWNGMGVRMIEDNGQTGYSRPVTPTEVALILIGMKLSRTVGAIDHEDNWLDLAGYAGLGAELAQGEK